MPAEQRVVREYLFLLQGKAITDKFTYSKELRLTKRNDFLRIKAEGERLYSRNLIIYYLPNSLNHPRLGVTVSKKVSKKAVIRNKIKRRMREIFRINQHNLSSTDILIIAKFHSLTATYQELEANFIKALRYAEIFKNPQ